MLEYLATCGFLTAFCAGLSRPQMVRGASGGHDHSREVYLGWRDPIVSRFTLARVGRSNWSRSMAMELVEAFAARSADTSSMESIGFGGGPASGELPQSIIKAIPSSSPNQGYGATEVSSAAATVSGEDFLLRKFVSSSITSAPILSNTPRPNFDRPRVPCE